MKKTFDYNILEESKYKIDSSKLLPNEMNKIRERAKSNMSFEITLRRKSMKPHHPLNAKNIRIENTFLNYLSNFQTNKSKFN